MPTCIRKIKLFFLTDVLKWVNFKIEQLLKGASQLT